jgi:type I restriction enzyme R subunit
LEDPPPLRSGESPSSRSFQLQGFLRRCEFQPQKNKGAGSFCTKRAISEALLQKYDEAAGGRRFHALLATASINATIEYHAQFAAIRTGNQAADPEFQTLNIA